MYTLFPLHTYTILLNLLWVISMKTYDGIRLLWFTYSHMSRRDMLLFLFFFSISALFFPNNIGSVHLAQNVHVCVCLFVFNLCRYSQPHRKLTFNFNHSYVYSFYLFCLCMGRFSIFFFFPVSLLLLCSTQAHTHIF